MTAESLPIRDGFLARLIVAAGQKLVPRRVQGHLILTLPSGRQFELGRMSSGPSAEIHLKSWQPVWASVRRASVGFCESYMEGHWESPDPARVIGFYLQNRDSLDRAARPIFFRSAIDRFRHVLRNNSVKGSRRNIEAHYDLGNDFYRLWLDETMTYSSAWFCAGAVELADAQRAKYRLVLETLGLRPGEEWQTAVAPKLDDAPPKPGVFNKTWLEQAKPGLEWLAPEPGFAAAIASVNIAIKHAPGTTLELSQNGIPVPKFNFEGAFSNNAKTVSLSRWPPVAGPGPISLDRLLQRWRERQA